MVNNQKKTRKNTVKMKNQKSRTKMTRKVTLNNPAKTIKVRNKQINQPFKMWSRKVRVSIRQALLIPNKLGPSSNYLNVKVYQIVPRTSNNLSKSKRPMIIQATNQVPVTKSTFKVSIKSVLIHLVITQVLAKLSMATLWLVNNWAANCRARDSTR